MTPIMTTVTEYEEKILDLMTKLQDEVLNYLKQAVDALDQRIPEFDVPEIEILDRVPTLGELVDTQFAFSKKVLSNQEKFAKNVVKAVKPFTREAAKPATKTTAKKATAA